MWSHQSQELSGICGHRYELQCDSRPASVAMVIQSWQTDRQFRTWFNAILAAAPYPAFRWETPAVTRSSQSQPFEFVLLDGPELDCTVDPIPFADHFDKSQQTVVVPNLGGDAMLVIPRPESDHTAYGHLGTFVRLAPEMQRDALWQSVGTALSQCLGNKPVWLNTAGAGVAWLHVRLDQRPKYYHYVPYQKWPRS